jgi:hypothetical protein
MPLAVVINSVMCLAGTILGVLLAGASILSIANMKVAWVDLLVIAALLVPVMFVASGIGVWLAYAPASLPVVVGLVALPWLYSGAFIVLMLRSFEG